MKSSIRALLSTTLSAVQSLLGYPALVIVVGIALTVAGTWIAWAEIQRERRLAFSSAVERIDRAVERELASHAALIDHWRDVLSAAPGLSNASLRRVLQIQQRSTQYSGIRKLALVTRVPAAQKEAFERSGFGDRCNSGFLTAPPESSAVGSAAQRISIRPPGDRAVYFPVCFDLDYQNTNGVLGADAGMSPEFLAALKYEQRGPDRPNSLLPGMHLHRLQQVDPAVAELPALVVPISTAARQGPAPADAAASGQKWMLVWLDFNALTSAVAAAAPPGFAISLRDISQVGQAAQAAQPGKAGKSGRAGAVAGTALRTGSSGAANLWYALSTVHLGDTRLELSVSVPFDSIKVEEDEWPLSIILAGFILTVLLSASMFSLQRSRRLAVSQVQRLAGDVREREQRFRDLVETTTDWVWETDSNGVYTYSSPSSTTLFGYSPRDLVGTRGERLWGATQVTELRRDRMTSGVRRRMAHHRSGSSVSLDSSAVPILGPDGQFLGWRGFDRDVSRRVKLEEELEAMQGRLRGAIQSESVGHAMVGLAHEINQPLAAIAAYNQACLRLAASDPSTKPEILEALRATTSHAMIAADIVRKFRDMSASHPITREPVRIADIIESAVGIVSARIDKERINMQVTVGPKVPAVLGDATLLVQVLMNLIQNAVDAVTGAAVREIRIGARVEGDERVRVEVSDTGSGVAEGDSSQIFNPYYTTKADGVGMGLAICRAIIEAHGETIDMRSTREGRTVFWFTLAAAEAAHA